MLIFSLLQWRLVCDTHFSETPGKEIPSFEYLQVLLKNQGTEKLYNPHVLATRPRIGTIRKNHIQSRFTLKINLLYLIALNLILS